MRNMRSAFWALGLAGAAYAWRNCERLQQQLNRGRGQMAPRQLPDYNQRQENILPDQEQFPNETRDRQWGGAEV